MKAHFKRYFISPLNLLLHDSRSVGIILLVCTACSLILTNWGEIGIQYLAIWNDSFSGTDAHHLHILGMNLPNSPLLIINDGLMAVFFFLAGMEIKREMLQGELATIKQSLLPVFGAIGGMIVPAIIFFFINKGTDNIRGWAIPTATDIAFTLGVASLLGKRIPTGLKVFLTALAIIDDLGAIVVIAIFYGSDLQLLYLLGTLVFIGIIYFLNHKKVPFGIWQILFGIALWYFMFNSGIHATVAGVIFAFLVPTELLKKFETKIHIPVYFIIIPIFALANTAIPLPSGSLAALNTKLSWGIILGLCLGKPIGITAFSYYLVKRKWAELPDGVNLYKLIGAGILAGIGFTMSIFISTLAFNDVVTQNSAKVSVLAASISAIIIGWLWFRFEKKPRIIPV
ncbi:MAG: Na+/H+ antiporter NhaA [Bacteroidota bacterium]